MLNIGTGDCSLPKFVSPGRSERRCTAVCEPPNHVTWPQAGRSAAGRRAGAAVSWRPELGPGGTASYGRSVHAGLSAGSRLWYR